MRGFRFYYAFFAISILGTSCTKIAEIEVRPPSAGNIIELPFRYTVAKELSGEGSASLNGTSSDAKGTRAPSGVIEDTVYNVWIFQFDGTTSGSRLVGSPHYVNLTQLTAVPLVESGTATHRLVFIANVNDPFYNWNMTTGSSTYQSLIAKYKPLNFEGPTHGDDQNDLLMCGYQDLVIGVGASVNPELVRSVARLELKLSIDPIRAAGFEVMSVQLCNIPNRLDWFDNLIDHTAENEIYPFNSGLIDYDPVTTGLPTDNGVAATFQWYVPRNTQGIAIESSSATSKTAFAPGTATYFKIIAKDKNNEGVIFRIYPGADMTNDFNLIPNYSYSVNLNIVGLGDSNVDSRVENFGAVTFPNNSNCYILNPPLTGMKARVFKVPISRVNEYWSNAYTGYGNTGTGGLITNSINWEVELYWQDRADLVTNKSEYADSRITLSKSSGQGALEDGYFSVTVPTEAGSGNFLVAIRTVNGSVRSDIFWSWHFWVTDYNPDQPVSIMGNKWTYPVPGGQVERYGSPVFGFPNNVMVTSNPLVYSHNYAGYDPTVTVTAPYAQAVVMDRYVGALNSDHLRPAMRGALFYQFGRKDPLPGTYKIYNIDGVELTTSTTPKWNSTNANSEVVTAGKNMIPYSINNPLIHLQSSGDWSGLNENTFLWLDGNIKFSDNTIDNVRNRTGRHGKSIYDPCPLGWKMPFIDLVYDFQIGVTTINPGRNLPARTGSDGAARYWPYIPVGSGYPVEGRIYYSSTGYRNTAGTIMNTDVHGKEWTVNLANTTSAYQISHITNDVNNGFSTGGQSEARAQADPVRCVREMKADF